MPLMGQQLQHQKELLEINYVGIGQADLTEDAGGDSCATYS